MWPTNIRIWYNQQNLYSNYPQSKTISTQYAPRFSDDGTIFTAYTIRSTQLFQTDPTEETQSELDSEADGEITKEVAYSDGDI